MSEQANPAAREIPEDRLHGFWRWATHIELPGGASWNFVDSRLLICVVLTLMFATPLRSFDVWWHLDFGRWMLEHGEVLTREIRSFTYQGAVWNNFAWAFQVLLGISYQLGGIWGLVVLKLGLTFAVLYLLSLAAGRRFNGIAFFLVIYLLADYSIGRMHLRPHLLEGVFLAALLLLMRKPFTARSVLWYFPLFLLWFNSHASAIVGFAALGMHAMVGDSLRWQGWRHYLTRALWLLPVGLPFLLTPMGWGILEVLFGHAGGDFFQRLILEWRRDYMVGFLLVVATCVVAWAYITGAVRTNAGEVFLLLFFVAYAIKAARFEYEWVLVLVPGLVRFLSESLPRLRGASAQRRVGAAFLVLVMLGTSNSYARVFKYEWSRFPGNRLDYPHTSARALAQVADRVGRPLRVFNQYRFGGFLSWYGNGRIQIVIDGRTPTVFPETHLLRVLAVAATPRLFKQWAERWQVDAVVRMRTRGRRFAADDKVWALVAYDNASMVYLRRSLLAQSGLTAVDFNPSRTAVPDKPETLREELRQAEAVLRLDADNFVGNVQVAARLGAALPDGARIDLDRAIRLWRRSLELNPGHVTATLVLCDLLHRRADASAEIVARIRALDFGSVKSLTQRIALAELLVAQGEVSLAAQLLDAGTDDQLQSLTHSFRYWLVLATKHAAEADQARVQRDLAMARFVVDPADEQALQRIDKLAALLSRKE